jgi:hypothetical protein
MPKEAVERIFLNPTDRRYLKSLFTNLCRRGFTPNEVETMVISAAFGSDLLFMTDQTSPIDIASNVLAACFFMRIKKQKEIYVELICSNTKNGLKILNSFCDYVAAPNVFQDGITYDKVSLLAANETVKELYERIGFKEIPEKEESMYLVRPIAVSHGGKQII